MSSLAVERVFILLQHLKASQYAAATNVSAIDASSGELPLRALFNYRRVREDKFNKVWYALFVIYAPVGVVLVAVRIVLFIATFVFCPLLPATLCRIVTPQLIRLSLGIILRTKHTERLKTLHPIIVTNHIHDYDTYLVPMIYPHCRPLISEHTTKIPIIGPILKRGYSAWKPLWVPPKQDADARDTLKNEVTRNFTKFQLPIAILPEGGLTNGNKGLLLFKRFIFSLGLPVQPIATRYVNVWPVHQDFLGSTWLNNMLVQMFLPFHIFEMEVLPPMAMQPGERPEQYAKRVQVAMGKCLHLEATNHTYEAKNKLRKEICGW